MYIYIYRWLWVCEPGDLVDDPLGNCAVPQNSFSSLFTKPLKNT